MYLWHSCDDKRGDLDLSLYSIKLLFDNLKKRDIKVDFLWILSRCRIEGNDQADKLAKEALSLNVITFNLIQFDNLTNLFRKKMKEDRQILEQESINKGSLYFNKKILDNR